MYVRVHVYLTMQAKGERCASEDRQRYSWGHAQERGRRDDGQRVRVTEKEGEKRSSELREREKEREREIGENEGEQKRENTIEGKRASETARERDVRVTPAARRVASRRLASLKARAMGARRLVERGGSQFSTAFLRGCRCESARGLPDHAGFNYSPRGLSLPRLYVVRFFSGLSLPLDRPTGS